MLVLRVCQEFCWAGNGEKQNKDGIFSFSSVKAYYMFNTWIKRPDYIQCPVVQTLFSEISSQANRKKKIFLQTWKEERCWFLSLLNCSVKSLWEKLWTSALGLSPGSCEKISLLLNRPERWLWEPFWSWEKRKSIRALSKANTTRKPIKSTADGDKHCDKQPNSDVTNGLNRTGVKV